MGFILYFSIFPAVYLFKFKDIYSSINTTINIIYYIHNKTHHTYLIVPHHFMIFRYRVT